LDEEQRAGDISYQEHQPPIHRRLSEHSIDDGDESSGRDGKKSLRGRARSLSNTLGELLGLKKRSRSSSSGAEQADPLLGESSRQEPHDNPTSP
jgi:hypothetical protein